MAMGPGVRRDDAIKARVGGYSYIAVIRFLSKTYAAGGTSAPGNKAEQNTAPLMHA